MLSRLTPPPSAPLALSATLALSAVWLPVQAADTANTPHIAEATAPLKSPFDSRDYRVLTLDNGLTALLVSDPEADKAAASMNVSVGSAQDPDDLQGLAHLLEHMLFLGTEPYPEPDAYQGYISQHAGSHNAFTAAQDTNYFFDIEPSALSGALDRFSAFFLSPLFNADKLESERNIVDSEYQARRRDESRRENDVLNQVLNPAHPGTRFSVGSRETLADRPDGEPTLRERMIDFYHGHYGAGVMHLAVVAPQPLDELEQMVAGRFAALPNRGLERPTLDAPLVDADSLPRYLERQTLKDSRQVRFLFPVPDPQDHYAQKPTQLLSHLLGDEGEGSVLAVLRDAGLADGLSAGLGRHDGEHALFNVAISLTPAGSERLDDIQATLFAAIDNIAANGLEPWRYDEQASLQEQAFRFQQHGAPQHEATELAMRLSRYPVKDVQYAPYRMDGFDAERVTSYLEALSPDNMIRVYSSPDVDSDQVSPWFDTQWQEVSRAAAGRPADSLALPAPNPFIADDLTLQKGHDDAPSLLTDDAHFSAWHMQVERFDTPKVEWRVSLQHPSVRHSAEEAVLNRLLAAWLNDSLNEALYPARLAGQSFSAYAHARGITLAFSGWRDGQAPLIERALEQLESAAITPADFARVRYQLEREWRNAPDSALFGQGRRTLNQALLTPQWSTEELLEASQRLKRHHLKDFRKRFLGELHVDAMAVGNLDAEFARRQAETLKNALRPRLSRDDIAPLTPLAVSTEDQAKDTILRPHSTRDESLVLRYLQGNEDTPRQQATASVLAQWLQTPFYQRLRTQEQLGYIVNAGYYPLLDAPGLALVVQSPDADSATVAERMDVFMADIKTRLAELEDAALAPYRQAVHSALTQRDTSLGQLANRYWQATALEDVRFDRRQRRADQALEVSVDDVRTLWETLLERRLEVRFDPGDTPSDVRAYRDGLSEFSATDKAVD